MRKLNSNLVMDFISEKGNDQIEKTYIACTPLENYMCIAIAESYDNETEENSAQIAVQAALSAFIRKPSLKRIPEYIRYANKQIFLHSTRCQLKVSLTVFVTDYTWMRYAICGNTKLYCIYGNIFTLTGRTQTIYQQLLDKDAGTEPDQSEIHNLTGYLGKNHHIKPLISRKTRLTEGSVLLFATSNMWGRLSDVEILDAYENTKTNKEFLDTLQEMLLSLQGQGQQKIGSYTAAFLSVEKVFHEDVQKEKKKKRIFLIIIIAVFILALALCITVLVIRASDRKKIKQIREYDKKAVRYADYGNYDKALEEYGYAEETVNKLNMYNWQYINEKKELAEIVTGRKFLTELMQEAGTAFTGQDYKQAGKIYKQAQQEAAFQGLDAVGEEATAKLAETEIYIQVSQVIILGDMYVSAGEYEEALKQYEKVLELLNKVNNFEMQAEIQAKIFDARSQQKAADQEEEEIKKAEEEARQEKAEKKKKEKEKKKQQAADREIIQMNTLITSASKALEEGRIKRAGKLYKDVLSKYNSFSGNAEDAEGVYKDIIELGQAITEAKAKEEEEAEQKKLVLASKYILQAKEAARNGKKDKAVQYYEKALEVYKEMDIWDERPEAVYEALEELETEES